MLIYLMIHDVFACQNPIKNLGIWKNQPLDPSKTCSKLKTASFFNLFYGENAGKRWKFMHFLQKS